MKFGQNPLNLCARCPWSFRAQHKAFRWLICQHSCCNPNWRAELVSASSQLCAGTGVLPPLFRQFAGQILKNRPRTRTRHRLLEMGWLRFRGQVLSAAACANSEDLALDSPFYVPGRTTATKLSLPLLERGVTYYNFTSNQFSGFHGIVIPGTLHDLRGKKPLNSAVRLLEGSR
jgi:hypothetical protein